MALRQRAAHVPPRPLAKKEEGSVSTGLGSQLLALPNEHLSRFLKFVRQLPHCHEGSPRPRHPVAPEDRSSPYHVQAGTASLWQQSTLRIESSEACDARGAAERPVQSRWSLRTEKRAQGCARFNQSSSITCLANCPRLRRSVAACSDCRSRRPCQTASSRCSALRVTQG